MTVQKHESKTFKPHRNLATSILQQITRMKTLSTTWNKSFRTLTRDEYLSKISSKKRDYTPCLQYSASVLKIDAKTRNRSTTPSDIFPRTYLHRITFTSAKIKTSQQITKYDTLQLAILEFRTSSKQSIFFSSIPTPLPPIFFKILLAVVLRSEDSSSRLRLVDLCFVNEAVTAEEKILFHGGGWWSSSIEFQGNDSFLECFKLLGMRSR